MRPMKKLIVFSFLTLFFSGLLWGGLAILEIPVSNLETANTTNPLFLLVYILNGFLPSIIGLILICKTEKEDKKEMIRSILPRKGQMKAILEIVLIFIGCFIMQILLYEIFIGGYEYRETINNLYQIFPLLILGPISEEIGWRGYMQKQALKITTPLKATFIIGVVWALWHLPLFYIIGTTQQVNNVSFITFAVLIMILSWVMTYYYINQKGSIFIAILIHWVYTVVFSFYVLSTDYSVLSDVLSIIPYFVVGIVLMFLYTKKYKINEKLRRIE